MQELRKIERIFLILGIGLTLVFALSLSWGIYSEYETADEFAVLEAKSSFNKDIMYRRWAAMHGGVYVKITEKAQPNPYLKHIPNRDIVTHSGEKLTLINPAYMTRQVFELSEDSTYVVRGHITSLNPIRPENKPDAWEEKALERFRVKPQEYYGYDEIDGMQYIRYMKPLYTEKGCLKCHADQGYKLGDLRGGISVSVPREKYNSAARLHANEQIIAHAFIYILVITLLFLGYKMLKAASEKRIKSENNAKTSEKKLKVKNEEYIQLNEQYKNQNLELLEAYEKLEDSEKKYRRYIEFSPTPIFVANKKTEYIYANNAACELVGYTFDEIVKMSIRDLMDPKLKDVELVSFRKLQDIGFVHNFKTSLKRKDGTLISIVMDSVKASDNQHVAFCKDISSIEQAERLRSDVRIAENTAQMKQQLLANISHEMRTPMNGIIGMLDFLSDTNLDAQQEDYVETIKDSSESLLHLINDVLNLSKIEKGQLKLIKSSTNIYNLISNTVKIFKGQAKQKRISLDYIIDEEFPVWISIDKNQMKQVIFNLVSNAIKYTNKGSVVIFLKIYKKEGIKVTGKIDIEDTGIGIDSQKADDIFKPFTRIDDSYTRTTEGTGLGLSIVKSLVELMGGQIGFSSKIGEGSKFWFTFQTEISDKRKTNEETVEISGLSKHNVKILLAEDKIVNQRIAAMILEKNGCKVKIANNGKEVLEVFKESEFDIILMDIMMPEMDGIEAMRKLRETYQNLPPIIGLSAHALEGDARRFIDMGLDDYLEKPINKKKLLNKIQYWINKY